MARTWSFFSFVAFDYGRFLEASLTRHGPLALPKNKGGVDLTFPIT
jgi:hypothetical protein